MLVKQNRTRINVRALVITANGSANTIDIINIAVIEIPCKATILIHSAIPNTSDLVRCVLQQQNRTATGSIIMYGIAGGLVLYAKYMAMGIPGKQVNANANMYNEIVMVSRSFSTPSGYVMQWQVVMNAINIDPTTVTPHMRPQYSYEYK